MNRWGELPYYSLRFYLRETFGTDVYKLSLNAGLTCPNRDGTLDTRGCIFCSAGGSGDFAAEACRSITEQMQAQKEMIAAKQSVKRAERPIGYIAYFQAFTNTYGPIDYLRKVYEEAIADESVAALSIATRPDCLSDEVIALLQSMNEKKPVWVELGLQTIHEETARYIRRGYELDVFDRAVARLRAAGIRQIIVHVIIGLPGEGETEVYQTIDYLNRAGIDGIKLQLLHVLSGTDLAADYEAGYFTTLTKEEYIKIVCGCIARLSPKIVIHRMTGDAPKALLKAPLWSGAKMSVLNGIGHELKQLGYSQGCLYTGTTGF